MSVPSVPEFKVGDVAKLKSGGPQMTVTAVETEEDGTVTVYCKWFDKAETERNGNYPAGALNMF